MGFEDGRNRRKGVKWGKSGGKKGVEVGLKWGRGGVKWGLKYFG